MPHSSFILVLILTALGLSACAMDGPRDVPSRTAISSEAVTVPMKRFGASRPFPSTRSNREITRDFLDLAFILESGRKLPYFSRFERPVTVRVIGTPVPTLTTDLDRLLVRLREEAGIDIARLPDGADEPANITVEAVSRARIRRELPTAACFVVPNVSSLAEYRGARSGSWTELRRRDRVAIFLPADSSPQEVRDCLHEELAQALGPLNDLYRLPDSVFNDDNVHAVLTGFDMLVLRAWYAPELTSGMTRGQVAERLPALLARLNPAGERVPPQFIPPTTRAWIDAVQTALGPGSGAAARRNAAARSLQIARAEGWSDHRLAFSHFALARMLQANDPNRAIKHLLRADAIYGSLPGTELHRAFVASQLAAAALGSGRPELTLELIEPYLPVVRGAENAALLATLEMLRAEALETQGRVVAARNARLDSLGWARYGYGADWTLQRAPPTLATLIKERQLKQDP